MIDVQAAGYQVAIHALGDRGLETAGGHDGSLCAAPGWLAAGGVSAEEARRMMTIDAAFVLLMDEKIGSLEAGKFADLIVLSRNPLTIDPDTILDIEVLMTMVGGRVEYCLAGSEALCPSQGP